MEILSFMRVLETACLSLDRWRVQSPAQHALERVAEVPVEPGVHDGIEARVRECEQLDDGVDKSFTPLPETSAEALRTHCFHKIVNRGGTPTDQKQSDDHRQRDGRLSFHQPRVRPDRALAPPPSSSSSYIVAVASGSGARLVVDENRVFDGDEINGGLAEEDDEERQEDVTRYHHDTPAFRRPERTVLRAFRRPPEER